MPIDPNWILETVDEYIEETPTWSNDSGSGYTGVPDADQSAEIFYKKVPGTVDKDIDVDNNIGPDGDLIRLEGIDTIVRSLITLLVVPSRTYLFDPEFGVGLYRYIFEQSDEKTKDSIINAVNGSINRYETRANVTTDVTFYNDRKAFRLDIIIEYNGEKKDISIDIDESILKTVD